MTNVIEQDETDSPEFSTWQELDEAVRNNGGVLRVAMWALRDISGYQRLKVRVLEYIQSELANVGLAQLPPELPGDQNRYVVLYKAGSHAAAVIDAVRTGTSTEAAEAALRRLNTSDAVHAGNKDKAKLADLADKVDELEDLLEGFRSILGNQR
ncbi:hypothetical protein [Streptomyces parvus]|uniref:hypothetical protein n=1 Tax=Streptomyces parvus TaxID=66428 RepID=UPI0033338093